MYELVSAKLYYKHKWAIGSVVLHNGHCIFHGTHKEAKEALRTSKETMKRLGIRTK